jgi:hypothetical protein
MPTTSDRFRRPHLGPRTQPHDAHGVDEGHGAEEGQRLSYVDEGQAPTHHPDHDDDHGGSHPGGGQGAPWTAPGAGAHHGQPVLGDAVDPG